MLSIRLETWDGAEYTLPVLVRWSTPAAFPATA